MGVLCSLLSLHSVHSFNHSPFASNDHGSVIHVVVCVVAAAAATVVPVVAARLKTLHLGPTTLVLLLLLLLMGRRRWHSMRVRAVRARHNILAGPGLEFDECLNGVEDAQSQAQNLWE